MSSVVLPSPLPLSASLFVTDTSTTAGDGSTLSDTVTPTTTRTILWLAGHSTAGVAVSDSVGGTSSRSLTVMRAVPWLPAGSVATTSTSWVPMPGTVIVASKGAGAPAPTVAATPLTVTTAGSLTVPRTTNVRPGTSAPSSGEVMTTAGAVSSTIS